MKLNSHGILFKSTFSALATLPPTYLVAQRFFFSILIGIWLLFGNVLLAQADFKALELCEKSPAFHKRLESSTKKLESRLKFYAPNTREALTLANKIELTKKRFKNYESATRFCGKDGLPRVIVGISGNYLNEFIFPALLFLYIAGWIGWVSRNYLKKINELSNNYESEIIIDVPLALPIMIRGYLWPVHAIQEISAGYLVASKENITVSPR